MPKKTRLDAGCLAAKSPLAHQVPLSLSSASHIFSERNSKGRTIPRANRAHRCPRVLGPGRDLGESRARRSSQGHSSVSAARGRPSWPLSRKLAEASCAALTARRRQAVSASFERASFHLLSRVQALQNTAARNKPYPQPKNPSQAGPRQHKGAPGFWSRRESGVHLCDEAAELPLAVFKTLPISRGVSPLSAAALATLLMAGTLGEVTVFPRGKETYLHLTRSSSGCILPWLRLAPEERQSCPAVHRPGCPRGARSLHVGTPSHPWAPACPSALRSLQSLYLGSGGSYFSLVGSFYTSSAVQSPRRVRLWETLPGLQHASLAGFFSTARWLGFSHLPQASQLKLYNKKTKQPPDCKSWNLTGSCLHDLFKQRSDSGYDIQHRVKKTRWILSNISSLQRGVTLTETLPVT